MWLLQAGVAPCDPGGNGCKTMVVATGALDWALGDWMTLKLSAKQQGGGKTALRWSASAVGEAAPAGEVHTAMVDTLEEAAAAVAFGNGFKNPLSEWDNLTVTRVV